ncbi:DCC1-like thiol-disulfide oxidoreductase family protein [Phycicoccus sp. Soil803]|uniref:DCC1-like thiol-disulfide oxidoreductase family protein n=1 Tax=Phycicoccus sp. Soil803 TaxID=1736415 RepID=UPI000A47F658|nr:DCC1-like thiol-disulfide oxidoreductase family protein [Phycicoccus sp. Soil803]
MNKLVVLYDAGCPICSRFGSWLVEQPHLVPVTAVPAGSAAARELLPHLDHAATLRDITVVADTGAVWTGASAWVTCLWATVEHRDLALRLSTPLGLPVARAMAYAAAGLRASLTTTHVPEARGPEARSSGATVPEARGPEARSSGATGGGGYADDCDGLCAPV